MIAIFFASLGIAWLIWQLTVVAAERRETSGPGVLKRILLREAGPLSRSNKERFGQREIDEIDAELKSALTRATMLVDDIERRQVENSAYNKALQARNRLALRNRTIIFPTPSDRNSDSTSCDLTSGGDCGDGDGGGD